MIKQNINIDEKQNDFYTICDVIRNILEDKQIELSPDTTLEKLGFDSYKFIKLILKLEDFYHMELEQIELKVNICTLKTIQDFVSLKAKLK